MASDRQDVQDTLSKWIEAANSGDAVRLARLYAPDANVLYGWGELVSGESEIEAHFRQLFAAFPNWKKEGYGFMHDAGEWATLEWRAEATFLSEYRSAKPTGRSFRLRGCGVFRIRHGRIRLHRRYFDRRDWYQQLGIT